MKVALVTDDQETISKHFGRAAYYLVITIEDGNVVQREMRSKMGHNHFAEQEHGDHHHNAQERHGFDSASHNRHVSMAQAISDCETVICGGMGAGAYDSLRRLNIQPIITELNRVDDVLKAYLTGNLKDRTDLLH